MYVDAIEVNGMVCCWYRDTSGELFLIEEPAPYYCYRRDEKNGTELSMFGDPLTRVEFDTRREFNDYTKKRSGSLFESDIAPVYKFLSQSFYNIDDTTIHDGLFDIEVDYNLEDGKGYPKPQNPFGKINSVSLYKRHTDTFHLIALHDEISIDIREDEKVEFHWCVTERQLLDTFFKLIEDIDNLSAWFGDGFDIPYILARCEIIYGESDGRKKLCRDGFKIRSQEKFDDFGNEFELITLVGRNHIDYMELYKNFTFGERESYALDSICETELKENKVEYKGDLGELYRTDPKTFFEYSLHDARLLKLLDDKLKFLDLAAAMVRQATCRFVDIFGSIKFLELSIMNHCHFDRDEVIRLPDKNPDNEREPFPGAYVLETEANAYGWVSSIDLASLYPSTIRAINISPETHMFQCKNNGDDFVRVVGQSTDTIEMIYIPTGETIEMSGWEIYNMLREENFTISAYGSIFENKLGLIPEVLALWYSDRKAMKKKGIEYMKEGDKVKGQYYDMMQNLKKLNLNSLYGAISNPYSRFYSIFLAASVTSTGQVIEKFQMWKSDQIVIEKVKENDRG